MVFWIKNPHQFSEQLKKHNKPFIWSQTLSTCTIKYNGHDYKYVEKTGLKNCELALIMMVKRCAEKCENIPYINPKEIPYINKTNVKPSKWYSSDLYEIDLNAAFWNFAYKFGYIDRKCFDYGLSKEVSKMARLVSLGALAKVTTTVEYNGNEFGDVEIIRCPLTEGIFFHVALETTRIMNCLRIISGSGYRMYWVDAIFLSGRENYINCCAFLNSEGIEFKSYKLEKLIQYKNTIEVHSTEHKKPKRVFNFHKTLKNKLNELTKERTSTQQRKPIENRSLIDVPKQLDTDGNKADIFGGVY